MATKRWLGRAGAVAQVDTITISGTWVAAETITLTINGKDLVITINSTTISDIAATIKEAWENETLTDTGASFTPAEGGQDYIEFQEITATEDGVDEVTLTHESAGVPFTLSANTNSAAGVVTHTTATSATGPNHWNDADNWDGSGVPSSSDNVHIENSDVSILYGLSNSATTLASLSIAANYTGTIGLPQQNEAGYVEYRTDYLAISATKLTIGRGNGSGSGRIKIDTGSNASTVLVESTGSPAENGLEAFLYKGSHASNSLTVLNGSVAVAAFGDDSANVPTVINTEGQVRCGAGCTLATVTNESGEVSLYANVTTLTNATGTILVGGSAAITTFDLKGGRCDYQSSGNITTLTIGGNDGATFDASRENSARTISTLNLKPNAEIVDPLRTLTYTAIAFDSDVRSWAAA